MQFHRKYIYIYIYLCKMGIVYEKVRMQASQCLGMSQVSKNYTCKLSREKKKKIKGKMLKNIQLERVYHQDELNTNQYLFQVAEQIHCAALINRLLRHLHAQLMHIDLRIITCFDSTTRF